MALLRPLLLAALALSSCSLPRLQLDQDQRMAWWREARFGMFIHWGLYAIPAGSWEGKNDYGEWIRHSAQVPRQTYAGFQERWNPTAFDAEAWARMAREAGMGYLVITSKHHDGFCLWDSPRTEWDIGGTRHRVDILAALAAACRRQGIRFGVYHSIMDWHHPDYLPRRKWETDRDAKGADFDRFETYLHGQVRELVEGYQPAIMWFDGEWESSWTHERGVRLFDHCRELDPAMLVNNRVDVHRAGMAGFATSDEARGDFQTPEQEIPATGVSGVDWESCMTMNRHWGWNAADQEWKATGQLLRNLIDIASKGGNYLLNVGPRADGSFPPRAVQRLAEIGAWMARNGRAIRGTTASVFEALDFGRCTVGRDGADAILYLHVFDRPADGLLKLPGLGSDPRSLRRLDGVGGALAWQRRGADVWIELPAADLDPVCTVLELRVAGEPVVYRKPRLGFEDRDFVHFCEVEISVGASQTARYTLDGTAPRVDSPVAPDRLRLKESCELRVQAFHGGRGVSPVVAQTFRKVEGMPAVEIAGVRPGLLRHRFGFDGDAIDDGLRQREAAKPEVIRRISAGAEPGEHQAQRLQGFIRVTETDLYRFALTSDDGSKLWIGGRLVVDNDGLHGSEEKRGAVALQAGLHPVTILWFNQTGGAELRLRWARPGRGFEEIPASRLTH